MANPTSNFNWQMPTASDLVTDLPADFEVFGQAVDTSLADLKGGTTDQVLAKNSNTDMDFKWVTSDDANAIQNSIVDAKGDLIAASANDTPARLAVGANGETLVADSSTSTGLRYQVAKPLNAIYNSAYDIWQRGTSSVGTAYNYTADRWLNFRGAFAAGSTFSRVASTQTGFQYALKAQRDSGNTGLDVLHLRQALETTDSLRFAGQTITLSFYAKAGANFSAASSYLVSTIYQGEGTDQATNNMTAWTNVTAVAQNNVLTTSWQRFSYTTSIASAKTQLGIAFTYTPVGTAGADDSYQITGVQVEVGSVATGFQRQSATIQGELAACQRYYFRTTGQAAASNDLLQATMFSTTSITGTMRFPVPMRTAATCSFSAAGDFEFVWSAGTSVISGANIDRTSSESVNLRLTSTGLTTNGGGYVAIKSGSTKWLEASAEL
jgi:hypothetical protein